MYSTPTTAATADSATVMATNTPKGPSPRLCASTQAGGIQNRVSAADPRGEEVLRSLGEQTMVRELELPDTAPATRARRFTDSVEGPPTVIGPRTRIKGELSGSDPVDLAGTLEGDSCVSAHYRVRPGGKVVGDIDAASLVVEGEVLARDLTAGKIEIGASARVLANLRAGLVAIAEGAFFDGEVHMQGAEAGAGPVRFKEQRRGQGSAEDDPPRT